MALWAMKYIYFSNRASPVGDRVSATVSVRKPQKSSYFSGIVPLMIIRLRCRIRLFFLQKYEFYRILYDCSMQIRFI
jgi:hypothetical protein